MVFESFKKSIETGDVVGQLWAGLIGEGAEYSTPFGTQKLVYADYTASGRALRQVEDFVAEKVLPFYANSHTEASYCGAYTTKLREAARQVIATETNAQDDCWVLFTGSGATAAVNRLVSLSGVADVGGNAVVFIGPYEHHSNILPWRESGAEVIEIDELPDGGPDLEMLEKELKAHQDSPLLIGAFSAASNVTGIITDTDAVTGLLKRFGALACWDYAGAGPYLPIDMNPAAGLEKDAIFLSPHKFPGGPGASGLLIIRNSAIRSKRPTWPGGGSVAYVSPWAHDYLDSIAEREEAGTPNLIGDIRAALVMLIKSAVGTDFIAKRDKELIDKAVAVWRNNDKLQLLGIDKANRLPIFSFIVRNGQDGYFHHQLFTRMLSDLTGVQVRGGCACAGPYGHRLLDVGRQQSERIRAEIHAGREIQKPGWARLNFCYLMDDATVQHIIDSVDRLSRNAGDFAVHYAGEDATGQFHHVPGRQNNVSLSQNEFS
jgi:selenocysteine lyase/cysteine desulfurase